MRVVVRVVVGIVLVGTALMLWAGARTDTYLGRWFTWRASDVADMTRFPSRPVAAASNPRPLQRETTEPTAISLNYLINGDERASDLRTLLSATRTSAFVAVRDGNVVVEWYDEGHDREAMVTSFSVAKSITALLALAALEDDHFVSLDEPITTYLPELAETDSRYRQITLRHLLDMRSGIRFRDHDLPWGDKARVYYEPNLRELVTTLPLVQPPGEEFRYNSYNPVLLGLAIERATGLEVADYLQERLWAPLGAEYAATWSVSRPGEVLPKMESGFNATAVDMARFGLLLLADGVADEAGGAQRTSHILGRAVLEPLLAATPETNTPETNTPEPDTPGLPSGVQYQQGWWIYPTTDEQPRALAALGHLGQYLFVYPKQNIVIARFGERLGGVESWRAVFNQIAQQLSSAD